MLYKSILMHGITTIWNVSYYNIKSYHMRPHLISTTTAMMTTITIIRKAPIPAPTSVAGNSAWDADSFLGSSKVMVFHFLFHKLNNGEILCSESQFCSSTKANFICITLIKIAVGVTKLYSLTSGFFKEKY